MKNSTDTVEFNTTTATMDNVWNEPVLVDAKILDNGVELYYLQTNKLNIYPMYESDRNYKIVFSCKGGLNKEIVEL